MERISSLKTNARLRINKVGPLDYLKLKSYGINKASYNLYTGGYMKNEICFKVFLGHFILHSISYILYFIYFITYFIYHRF